MNVLINPVIEIITAVKFVDVVVAVAAKLADIRTNQEIAEASKLVVSKSASTTSFGATTYSKDKILSITQA